MVVEGLQDPLVTAQSLPAGTAHRFLVGTAGFCSGMPTMRCDVDMAISGRRAPLITHGDKSAISLSSIRRRCAPLVGQYTDGPAMRDTYFCQCFRTRPGRQHETKIALTLGSVRPGRPVIGTLHQGLIPVLAMGVRAFRHSIFA